ncbi:DUF6266 family protein [Pedobacter deserti]|uniref:DUF6266 family protein n=1 Tax=Pedobacter deserti TaxID=2817382 RepID=UPI00210C8220|nr:DUF6266 family protein [Pedobacter sp. SYSU D00382]
MATLNSGLLGGYSGRLGNLVFYIRNGRQVVRTVGECRVPASEKQTANRNALAVVMAFLKVVREFVNIGFDGKMKAGQTAFNAAVSYHLKNAVDGVYPDLYLDYAKVKLACGRHIGTTASAVLNDDGILVTWDFEPHTCFEQASERVMLLAFFPVLSRAVYVLDGADRCACSEQLYLPPELCNAYMEVYMCFASRTKRDTTESVYLGKQNLHGAV